MRLPQVPEDPELSLNRRLARRLALARLALLWERLWPALVPLLSLAAVFVALALFELPTRLPGWIHGLLLAGFAGLFGFLGWRGLAGLRFPGDTEAARRLERDTALPHRPLAALADRPAAPEGEDDPVARALWQLHRRRMAEMAGRLRLAWPSPGMAARDPRAWRFAALLLLVIALAGGAHDGWRRLARALSPEIGGDGGAVLEVWITPPAYTGVPPLLLNAREEPGQGQDAPTTVPAGSAVAAVVAGGWGRAALVVDGRSTGFRRQGDGSQRVETKLEARLETGRPDGASRLAVEQGWRTVAAWPLLVVRDALPSIAFAEPPTTAERGRLRIAVEASDDYGLAKAWVTVRRLGAPEGEEPAVVELPLPGGRPKTAAFAAWQDLTAHPWAGLPATLTPSAEDAIGQVGSGEAVTITLPERLFNNPVAAAVVEKRRQLTEDPGRAVAVGRWLDGLALEPEAVDDEAAFLALRVARKILRGQEFDLAEVQDLMWNAALRIEEGDLAGAERTLEEARRALEQALAEDAPTEQIQALLDRYEEALSRVLAAMAGRMPEGAPPQPGPGDGRVVTDEDLAEMLEGMRALADTGNRDALRRMLSELSELMAGLQAGPPPPNPAAGTMEAIRELARRQQELLDQSFRNAEPGQPGADGEDEPDTPQARPRPGPGEAAKAAEAQEALRKALDGLAGKLGQALGGAPPQALSEAGQAMAGAAGRLGGGAWGAAAEAQGQALSLMKEGVRDAMRQLDAQGRGSGQMGLVPRDPFGRPMRGSGIGDDHETRVPDIGEVQRARQILDELRRRSGEVQRPAPERDYLKRLLKQY